MKLCVKSSLAALLLVPGLAAAGNGYDYRVLAGYGPEADVDLFGGYSWPQAGYGGFGGGGAARLLPDPWWYLDGEFATFHAAAASGGGSGPVLLQDRRAGAGVYIPLDDGLRGVIGAGYVGLHVREPGDSGTVRSDENGGRIYGGVEDTEDRLHLYANAGFVQLAHTSGPEIQLGARFDLYRTCLYIEYRKTQYSDSTTASVNVTPSELRAGVRLRFY